MVGNMIRVQRARMTLLAVDEAGMSAVEYSNVEDYTNVDRPGPRLGGRTDASNAERACLRSGLISGHRDS